MGQSKLNLNPIITDLEFGFLNKSTKYNVRTLWKYLLERNTPKHYV